MLERVQESMWVQMKCFEGKFHRESNICLSRGEWVNEDFIGEEIFWKQGYSETEAQKSGKSEVRAVCLSIEVLGDKT